VVRYLQQQYGGDELYIPQPHKPRNVDAILSAREKGRSIREICRAFSISRRTYYRLIS
jgi:DNA invertase Pin-like site-specific DNA recombinase